METTSVNLRSLNRETILVKDGSALAKVIYPANNGEYRKLAEKLAHAASIRTGVNIPIMTDEEIMPNRLGRLPDEYRSIPLILLGDINTNRLLVNLYSRHRCFTDADYPGGDGYELRTVINAYTRGSHVIVVGGSSLAGVSRAVDCLVDTLQTGAEGKSLWVPFLLQVEIEPGLDARLRSYPLTALNAAKPGMKAVQGYEIMRVIGNYAVMYAITGDRRYGDYAADCLRVFNAAHTDSYGDRHYFMERLLHAIYWLGAGGFFSDEEITQMDRLLLGTLNGAQDNWWRRKDGSIPLGHRHQSKGTMEFLQAARFIKENACVSPEVTQQCDTWIAECQSFLDALTRACIDDQDDETTLHNMAILFSYSLNEGRFYFFESGNARLAARRALALHDNMGAGAGQGGYGESMMSATYVQLDATTAVAASAFYYRDPALKWILENMAHLKEPLRGSIFIHTPIYMHNYSTGAHLRAELPSGLTGIQVLPVTEHQHVLNTQPPNHIEPMGHYVNKPETWQQAEGIGVNRLPRETGFDKLTLRESFDRQGAYLLLQGYQGGYNWQGHQQAANCIVRFSQFGKIFLVQNTRDHTAFEKNGVLTSDGWNVEGLSPYARLDEAVETAGRAVTVTTLPDSRGAEWRRHILWNKSGQGSFAVIDVVIPHADGEMSLTCTWRTLGYAELDGRTLTAGQGGYTFRIVCGEDLRGELREEPFTGATSPYVWRQYAGGAMRQGEIRSFHNLFYARPENAPAGCAIRKINESSGVLEENGRVTGWYRVSLKPEAAGTSQAQGFETDADLVWSTADGLVVAGATYLRWQGGALRADAPFSLALERGKAGEVSVSGVETLALETGGQARELLARSPGADPSWAETACNLVDAAWELAGAATASTALSHEAHPSNDLPPLVEDWSVAAFGVVPERVRNVRIFCDPSPLHGFDEQLIDGVPLELREFWQQWTDAPEYRIRLRFPGAPVIDSVRLLGDSFDEPLMRVFNPLPDGIRLASRTGGKEEIHQLEHIPEVVPFRRYRGQLDRVAGHRALVGREVDEIEITVPAPTTGSLSLQEIEIYGGHPLPAPVRLMLSDDLDGNRQPTVMIITEQGQVTALDARGGERWQTQAPGPVHFAACLDLLGDGRKFLCLGLLGGELRILEPDGSLHRSVQLAHQFQKPASLFGWMETINGLAVWRRDEQGRAALAVGSYGTVIYLDPDLNILGHTYVDGSWIFNILPVPDGPSGEGEVWVRSGWNHGINVFRGLDSFEPSGAFVDFGGVHQPLFRAVERVIPFHTGSTLAFEQLGGAGRGRILAAAEYGIGLIDPQTKEWSWRFGGLPRLTGCMADLSESPRVLTAASDGFVTVLDLASGAPLARRWLGSPLVGLARCNGGFAAAGREGVFLLDSTLETVGFAPVRAAKLAAHGEDAVLVLDTQNSLHCLKGEGR